MPGRHHFTLTATDGCTGDAVPCISDPDGQTGSGPFSFRSQADENVACPGVVQRAADSDEVFDLRLTCVRAIVRVIHASASSKLLKR